MDLHDAVCPVCVKQMSDLESELEILPSATVTELVSSTVPVEGESFCQCSQQEELSPGASECLCGEEDQGE